MLSGPLEHYLLSSSICYGEDNGAVWTHMKSSQQQDHMSEFMLLNLEREMTSKLETEA